MSLKDRLDQLEERERKLLLLFMGIFSALVLLLVPVLVAASVSAQRTENDRIRDIIQSIVDERVTLSRRQAEVKRVEKRYASQAPALASYLAQVADKVDVDIPETQDRSTVPAGKTFEERSTKIRLRGVGMLALSNFMESIARSGHAVSISKLIIRKRGTKADDYDVEMEVSAFDRDDAKQKSKADDPDDETKD